MDEREQASQSGTEHELASEVSERIRAIISSAEAAANAVRHEAEQRAQVKRRVAEDEAKRIVDDARNDADAMLAERIKRINELSDSIIQRAEAIVMRLDRAEEVRRQLQSLADSLGESAEELAQELGGSQAVEGAGAEVETEAEVAEVEPVEEPATAVEVEDAQEAAVDEEAAEEAEAADEAESAEVASLEQRREDEAEGEEREADDELSARLVALQMAVAGGNRGEVAEHLQRTFDVGDVSSILDDVFGSGSDAEKRVAWPRTTDGAA